jgi:hypothetical protein
MSQVPDLKDLTDLMAARFDSLSAGVADLMRFSSRLPAPAVRH